jgi:hypothetical protein
MSTEIPLEILQQRILAGETLSAEEYRRVIENLRSARTTASTSAAKKRRSSSSSIDFDLNAEIDQLLGRSDVS